MRESLTADGFWIARDLPRDGSHEEPVLLMRRLILKFGLLLKEWPALLEAAKNLRKNGVRLATNV
jgi:hypothetical protein